MFAISTPELVCILFGCTLAVTMLLGMAYALHPVAFGILERISGILDRIIVAWRLRHNSHKREIIRRYKLRQKRKKKKQPP